MKLIIIRLLFVVAAVLLPVFCPSPVVAKSEGANAITIWHDQDSAVSQWLKDIWAGLHAPLELKVQAGVDMEVALFRTRNETDLNPDAVVVVSNLIGLHRGFRFSKVSPTVLEPLESRFRESVRQDSRFYGVPLFASDPLIFYFNKSLANGPIPDLAPLENKSAGGPDSILWPVDAPFYFCPFIGAFAGWPKDNHRIHLDSEPVRSGLEVYFSLAHKMDLQIQCGAECVWQKFVSGKAMGVIATESRLESAESALQEKLGYSVLPQVGGHKLKSLSGSYALVFPFDGLNGPKGKWLSRFAAELLKSHSQELLLGSTRRLPVRKDLLDHILDRGAAKDQFRVKALRESEVVPNGLEMASVWPALRKAIHVGYENRDVQTAKFAEKLFDEYDRRLRLEVGGELGGALGGALMDGEKRK